MSHTVAIKTLEITDITALKAAVDNMEGAEWLHNGESREHTLYSGNRATGVGVKLPDWNYPAVFDLESGKVSYDNYSESWGKQIVLDELVQRYGVEKIKMEALCHGHTVSEQWDDVTGDVELEITDYS